MKKQKEIVKLNNDNKDIFENEHSLIEFISNVSVNTLYSSEIVVLIADSLQILDSKDQIQQFDLEDILHIYQSGKIANLI